MISRWIVHFECHWGYRPRFSIRRAPRSGDRVQNGGESGHLVGCELCSADGFLFVADLVPAPAEPAAPTHETESDDGGND